MDTGGFALLPQDNRGLGDERHCQGLSNRTAEPETNALRPRRLPKRGTPDPTKRAYARVRVPRYASSVAVRNLQ